MSKEKLIDLIDKAIGKVGPLRVPAYWMREILNKIIKRIPTGISQLTNDVGYITIKDTFSNVEITELSSYSTNYLAPNTIKIHEKGNSNYTVAIDTSETKHVCRYGLILRNSTLQRQITFRNSIYWAKPFPRYIQPFENILIIITKDSTGALYGDFELSKYKSIVLTYNITTLEPINLFHGNYKDFPPRTMIVDGNPITPTNVLEFESTGIHTVEIESDLLAGLFYSTSNEKYLESAVCDCCNSIGNNAFYNCKALTNVVLSDDVETIGNNAFYGCSSLTEFTLPKNISHIWSSAFSLTRIKTLHIKCLKKWCECYKADFSLMSSDLTIYVNGELLTKLEVPYETERIESYSFYDYKLSDVVINEGVEYIGRQAFCESEISSITVPSTLKEVGSGAFYGNSTLSRVYISDLKAWCECEFMQYPTSNPIVYGAALYLNGEELKGSIRIPDGTTKIGTYAFTIYTRATSIIFPESIRLIMNGAFDRCSSIKYFDFSNSTTVPLLNATNAFSSISSDCKIIVPDALYNGWIAATNWSAYAGRIIKKSDWDAQNATE